MNHFTKTDWHARSQWPEAPVGSRCEKPNDIANALEWCKTISQQSRERIIANPATSLAFALGVGFLFGWWIRRS